jgi:uncharacterized protein
MIILRNAEQRRGSSGSNQTTLIMVIVGWSVILVVVTLNIATILHMEHLTTTTTIAEQHSLRAIQNKKLPPPPPPQQQPREVPTYEFDLLPPTVWATRKLANAGREEVNITSLMTPKEMAKATSLCGKFLYSTLHRALYLKNMGQEVFVATGDIDEMWIRDSVVQMSIYLKHVPAQPWLRFVIEGAIRRNAFNILQDPYANAYSRKWTDPADLEVKDRVIGRGGYVGTRNYEVDSGAYFITHLYDYYLAETIRRPEVLLMEPMISEAVMVMVDTWITEQHHDELSPYRYFELTNQGKGVPSGYTGMTWAGFRPSDDACQYGYLIPANIHAAAALQRLLILNDRLWKDMELKEKASKLLKDIEKGINEYGVVEGDSGESIYAYEVDGLGGVLKNFDDANVPSLLSIPLLGWDGYNREVYENTRAYILSKSNPYYFEGKNFVGIGSPHTPGQYIWPMALVIQGLTETGSDRTEKMAFQMRQLIRSATNDAMHESISKESAYQFTRPWFEWANALFVIYLETVTGTSCAAPARKLYLANNADGLQEHSKLNPPAYYKNIRNDPWNPLYYQNVEASIKFAQSFQNG